MGAILKVNHRVALLGLHPKENKEGDNIVSGLLKCPTPWVFGKWNDWNGHYHRSFEPGDV